MRRIMLLLMVAALMLAMVATNTMPAFAAKGGTQTPHENSNFTFNNVMTPNGTQNSHTSFTYHCQFCF